MSLTKQDLNKIEKLIDQKLDQKLVVAFKENNDILMGRIIEVLQHFPTRIEMQEELKKLSDQMVKREEFLELKDDVAELKVEFRSFRLFTEHNLARHEQDIQQIKTYLHLQ